MSKSERAILIGLELAYAACAVSVVLYRAWGIFTFGWFSYRMANVAISIVIVAVLVAAIARSYERALLYASAFSAFHVLDGIAIAFWYKVVIHTLILIVVAYHYSRHRTLRLSAAAAGRRM